MYDLKDLLDRGERQARAVLLEKGEKSLCPMFLLVQPDDSVIVVGTPFEGDVQKQMVRAQLRSLMKNHGTVAYSFLCEAWAVKMNHLKPEDVTHEDEGVISVPMQRRPSEDPNRIEVVSVLATNGVENKYRMWEIKRDYKGKIRDLVLDCEVEGVMGPFGDLLTQGHA